MASTFPSTLDSFSNPSGSDKQSNPPHANQHSDVNDAIEAIESKIGINGSADSTSIDFKLSSIPAGLKVPVKATGVEVDAGTDDAKFITPKALADSTTGGASSGNYISHQVYTLGDSLTLGYAASVYGLIQKQLNSLLGSTWNVNNNGYSGYRTDQLLTVLNSDILSNGNAEYITVWAGINDVYQDKTAVAIETNLQAIYDAIHNAGAKVIALNISPSKASPTWTSDRQTVTDSVNAWIASTATNIDYKVDIYSILEDPGNPDQLLSDYNAGDMLHINDAADVVVGNSIYNGVTSSIWTPSTTDTVSDLFRTDGWIPRSEGFAYESASGIFVSGDLTKDFKKGDKVKFVQSSTVKYYYVSADSTYTSPYTHISLVGDTVANSSVRSLYYSKVENPAGFPQWFSFTPTISGSTGSIGSFAATIVYSNFSISGKTAHVQIQASITNVGSWTGNLQVQMPINPSTAASAQVQNIFQGAILSHGSLTIEGWNYDISSSGVMRYVSVFNGSIYPYSSIGVNDIVTVNATYQI